MLVKNNEYETVIDNLGCEGEGIAHIDGLAVFVRGALPGENVKLKITAVKSGYAYARLVEILSPSGNRTSAPCPVYGKCGGCDLQHLIYDGQLEYKQKLVADTLKKYAGDVAEGMQVNPCVRSLHEFRYRNKAQVPVGIGKDGRFICGFYRSNSNDIVDISDCLLHPEWFEISLKIFKDFLEKNALHLIDKKRGISRIRHFVMREMDGALIYTVVARDAAMPDFKPLYESLASATGKKTGIYLNINNSDGNIIFGEKFLHKQGVALSVHPASFMQVNDYIRERMYGDLTAALGERKYEIIIDAYSGAGRLTAMLSRYAAKVYGIEINVAAVRDADIFMRESGIANAENIAGDSATVLPTLTAELKGKDIAIVLDPPRKGCAESVLRAVAASNAKSVFYISCNPATLARDLKILCGAYSIASITPYDMFPQTANVETLVCLQRR